MLKVIFYDLSSHKHKVVLTFLLVSNILVFFSPMDILLVNYQAHIYSEHTTIVQVVIRMPGSANTDNIK